MGEDLDAGATAACGVLATLSCDELADSVAITGPEPSSGLRRAHPDRRGAEVLKSARAIFQETGGNKPAVFGSIKLMLADGRLVTDSKGVYRVGSRAPWGRDRLWRWYRNMVPYFP